MLILRKTRTQARENKERSAAECSHSIYHNGVEWAALLVGRGLWAPRAATKDLAPVMAFATSICTLLCSVWLIATVCPKRKVLASAI